MKVGLCVFELSANFDENMEQVKDYLYQMKVNRAELAVFPESCLTGLINSGNYDSDIEFAISAKDSFLKELAGLSYELEVSVSIGFLEKFEGLLFDSLLFLDSTEKKHYLYRRMSKGWKTAKSDLNLYKEGSDIVVANTGRGKFTFAICGDLFDNNYLCLLKSHLPVDYLIHPLVVHDRWGDRQVDQAFWDSELVYYCEQIKVLGCTSFMVNLLGTDSYGNTAFGGAWVISENGQILAEKLINESGVLYYEVK